MIGWRICVTRGVPNTEDGKEGKIVMKYNSLSKVNNKLYQNKYKAWWVLGSSLQPDTRPSLS